MSVIYTEKELAKIEKILGRGFITLYEKLWAERSSVKNYMEVVKANIVAGRSAFPPNLTGPHSKTYWEYKLGEVTVVLDNQNAWLRKVMEPLKEKISEKMYAKLIKYLEEQETIDREFITENEYEELVQLQESGELKDKRKYVVSGKILNYLLNRIVKAL